MLKFFPVRAFSMILICTDIKVHFVVLKGIPALRFVKSNFHTSHGTFSGNVFRVLLWQLLTYLWKLIKVLTLRELSNLRESTYILSIFILFLYKINISTRTNFSRFRLRRFCSGQPCSFWLQMALTVDGGQIYRYFTLI